MNILVLVIIVFVLNVLDLFFTLGHINWANGQEVNPVMNWILQSYGPTVFGIVKMGIISVALIVCYHLQEQVRWVHEALYILAISYILLIVYHLILVVKFW